MTLSNASARRAPWTSKLRAAFWVGALSFASLAGCIAPPPPAQQVGEAARALNLAARFGRMDVAADHTAGDARQSFVKRRSQWGRDLRVVDVELAGLHLPDKEHADVQVAVAWVMMNEGVLRNTVLAQEWERDTTGAWKLQSERRVSGDLGLFGDAPERVDTGPRPDVHFPSKTIR